MLDFFIPCIQTCQDTLFSIAKTDKPVPRCLGVSPEQFVNMHVGLHP